MSVATSLKRYINGFAPYKRQGWTRRGSPPSFSSSFLNSCRFWFAANSIWATLVVAAGITAEMRLPFDRSWFVIALVVLVSAGLSFREMRRFGRINLKSILILLLGLASTGFLLWPAVSRGAFVSVTSDNFLYTAFGQYLADHHRGLAYGLPPVDEYGAALSETRFGTASVLGFLSVLFHSSTVAVLPAYLFIVLANIFSGYVLLSRRFGCNRLFSLAAGSFAVIGGWTPNALNIGGLDNLLFLSLFPFLVVRLELYGYGDKPWSTSAGLAILGTSVFYAYPEGLAIAGVIFFPFFCQSLWSGMYRRGMSWGRYLISACLILVLVYPYAQVSYDSICSNFGTHMSRAAAGLFPGLLSLRFLPAMFGFGQEYAGTVFLLRDAALPMLMLGLIVVGTAVWIRRRKSLVLAGVILIAMSIWQGLWLKYDYGLYKILFIGSLVWIPLLFRGATAAVDFAPKPVRPIAATLGAIIFFSFVLAQKMEQHGRIPFRRLIPTRLYSELTGLRRQVSDRPVLLVCDNAFDPIYYDFDQEWAVFFLRQINLKIPEYFGYLGAELYKPVMQRAKATGEPADFVLVNKRIEGALWNNQRFSLLALGDQPTLIGVTAPAGSEQVNGKPFVWLGNKATQFLIVSKTEQTATFSATGSLTGSSRPQGEDQQIRISIGGDVWRANLAGTLSVQVPLKPGLNHLEITYPDSSAVSERSSGDTKASPAGLWDYRISR
jgi:hypothetical protein